MSSFIPVRSFFTKRIPVDGQITLLQGLIRKESPWRIRQALKELSEYLLYLESRHQRSLHPQEIAQLEKARKAVAEMKLQAEFPAKLVVGLADLRKELEKPFQISSVYLLRHPEKPGKQDEGKRNLSYRGVRQARDFAVYLMEEVLACPRPVRVEIFCSDLRRTLLLGMIIKKYLEHAQKHYRQSNLQIGEVTEHPALFSRFSPAALEETGPDIREKGEWVAFSNWIKGKYQLTPRPLQVSREVKAWAVEGTRRDSSKAWIIRIGISHSWIIDAFLHESLGRTHSEIMGLAEYVRFVGGMMDYQGKWYAF